MSGHIYILVDGLSTKIGITEQSLEKRLASYKTHNPNYYFYKSYECSIVEAKRIEGLVKAFFKEKIVGTGKEWFSVQPEEISKIVSTLLETTTEDNLTPAMHGMRLPQEVHKQKDEVLKALTKSGGWNNADTYKQKEKMAELFASAFQLGIPEHRLPSAIVLKDGLNVDIYECDKHSELAQKGICKNYIQVPYDDHTYNFYHLVKLATGNYVAICTSRVSMPYLKAIEGKFPEILDVVSSLGWYAFQYDDWSWHSPENTGLVLFMQKTPIQKRLNLWEGSFRKWVIERSKLLEQDRFDSQDDYEDYKKTIEDISYETTFPLHVQSVKELYDCYMQPYWGYSYDDGEEDKHFMMKSYEMLFDKWKSKK